jgi:hypothetical protein
MGIENLIEKIQNKWLETTVKLADKPAYKYSVDVLSGWLYYTPTYGLQELISGKDVDTVIKTRLIGLAVQAVALRPVGMLRNYMAKKWDVNKDSSIAKKIKVNFLSTTPIQSTLYSLMLLGGMTWSGNWDWKASGYSLLMGVGFSALHSFPYGYVQDGIRNFFGIKPAIGKKEIETMPVSNSNKNYLAQ